MNGILTYSKCKRLCPSSYNEGCYMHPSGVKYRLYSFSDYDYGEIVWYNILLNSRRLFTVTQQQGKTVYIMNINRDDFVERSTRAFSFDRSMLPIAVVRHINRLTKARVFIRDRSYWIKTLGVAGGVPIPMVHKMRVGVKGEVLENDDTVGYSEKLDKIVMGSDEEQPFSGIYLFTVDKYLVQRNQYTGEMRLVVDRNTNGEVPDKCNLLATKYISCSKRFRWNTKDIDSFIEKVKKGLGHEN